MINHAAEMQDLAEAQDYGDVEVILVDICNRLGVPDYNDEAKEINWVYENCSSRDLDLVVAIYAKAKEFSP